MTDVAAESSAARMALVAGEPRPPLAYAWQFEVPVSAAVLWRYISDTSKLNRALGLAPMEFEERDGELHGRARNGGREQRWIEHAWSWVAGRTMVAERSYSQGWASRVRVAYELEASETGTTLRAYFGWWPRDWFSRLVLALGMVMVRKRLAAVLAELTDEDHAVLPRPPVPPLFPPAEQRLRRACDRLRQRGCDDKLVARLAELIRNGHDDEVFRLRVRQLARDWHADEHELLEVFLYATRLGLLMLSWDVVCPHCRGPRIEADSLQDVPATASCEVCAVEFGTEVDNAVEVTFHLHPAVRRVEKQLFCSAQTSTQRHVVVQQSLAAGESRTVSLGLAAGRYRTRQLGGEGMALLDVEADGAREASWLSSAGPLEATLTPEAQLAFVNDADAAATFVIEELSWPDDVLTPAQLFCCARFRDLFSEQLIAPEVRLFVGEQVLLFTDLVGSTRMYVQRGDADAFATVRAHFRVIDALVAEHHGALVKTIGDAAMAVFDDATSALQAAFALRQHFADDAGDLAVKVRISLNAGVCLAVNLNARIDYFGHAVNVAAKLQALADAGELVASQQLTRSPAVAAWLEQRGLVGEEVQLRLRGIDPALAAWRYPARGGDGSSPGTGVNIE